MKIDIELPDRPYLQRELMPLTLVLRNDGDQTLRVPSLPAAGLPELQLLVQGPSFAEPLRLDPRGRAGGGAAAAASVELAPGQEQKLVIDIARLARFSAAGLHTVQAHWSWDGQLAESTPRPLRFEPARLLSARLMLDDGVQRNNLIRVLCLMQQGQQRSLYLALFREPRADTPETELSYLLRAGTAQAGADEALPTWTRHDRTGSFVQRYGWRGAASLGIVAHQAADPAGVELAAAELRIQPALMSADHAVQVFQWQGSSLALWRFPPPGQGAAQALWQLPLAPPLAARAGLVSATAGAAAVAVLAARAPGGAMLTLVETVAGQPRLRALQMPRARLLPASEPAVRVDAEGGVNALLVVAADNALRRLYAVEAYWPAGDGAGRFAAGAEHALGADVLSATAAFDCAGGVRSDWAALLADGRVLHTGGSRSSMPRATPLLPLQLLALGKHRYLLGRSADGTPVLEALL